MAGYFRSLWTPQAAGRPGWYNVSTTLSGSTGRLRITDQHVPRGKTLPVMPAWDADLCRREAIRNIDTSGNAFIVNGQFTPILPQGESARNLRGRILGMVCEFDPEGSGQRIGTRAIDLGKYRWWDMAGHVSRTLEIKPSKTGTLMVVERRIEGTGLNDDRSAFVYNISREGMERIRQEVIDLNWIRDVRVSGNGVTITFDAPGAGLQACSFPAEYFTDNFGAPLLGNRRRGVSSEDDIFQSEFYTSWTERFRPSIDSYADNNEGLKLVVHKVDRYPITTKETFGPADERPTRIVPSMATSAFETHSGAWIPLTLPRPIEHPEMIDQRLSKVMAGEVQSVIGPQTRLGNRGEISGDYKRDWYFYGFNEEFAGFRTPFLWGKSVGLNRAKVLGDKFMGIQSGRTHCQYWANIYDPLLADIMETNNPFYNKLSNFGSVLWGPGVSEDTQMDKFARFMGLKMWVVKQPIALMTAEKEWGRYKVQNTERYNRSEQLFVIPADLVASDVLQTFIGNLPSDFMNWGAISEIVAGRTWYKMPLARVTEKIAIPAYLLTAGHVLFYPVDLTFFLSTWAARTAISSLNYALQLRTIGAGTGFWDGFIKNPVIEDSFLGSYFKDMLAQHVEKSQFGTFMATVGGTGEKIPRSHRRMIQTFAALNAVGFGAVAASLYLGGLDQLASKPGIGLGANIFFGLYSTSLAVMTLRYMRLHALDRATNTALPFEPASHSTECTFGQLFGRRDDLTGTLREIKAMNRKRQPFMTMENPLRDHANKILEEYADIEMTIYLKAVEELRRNPMSLDARLAIRKLLEDTYEYSVVRSAGELFRDLNMGF